MGILTKEVIEDLEKQEYAVDVLPILDKFQEEHNYSDEEMNSDLEVVLWKSYAYINVNKYEFFELTEKILSNVKEEGVKNHEWCYRYACAIVYLRRFEEALEYCKKSVEINPDFVWTWLELAKISYKFGLLDEAYKAIETGLQLKPNEYTFLTLKDDIDNNRGFAFCLTHYVDEEADKDEDREGLLNIEDEKLYNEFLNRSELEKEIIILDELGKFKEIIDLISSLPKEKLTNNIIYSLSKAYQDNGEVEKAIQTLFTMGDIEKNTALWNHRMAYLYLQTNSINPDLPLNIESLEEAEKYIRKSLEIDPKGEKSTILYMIICTKLGKSKVESEEYEDGLKYLLKARELALDEEHIILTEEDLGWAYDHMEEYTKAYPYLQNAVSLGVDDIWVNSELGFCLGGLKKFEEAIKYFERAIELGRNDSWIYERIGVAYEELEKYDEALKFFLKASKVKARNTDLSWLLSEIAWIYNKKSDYAKGLEYLEKAKKLGRDDIWINSEFGWVYNELKDYPRGLKHLLKAQELGRDDQWINYELGYSLGRMERGEEALEYLFKAEKLGKTDEWLFSEIAYCLNRVGRYEDALPYLMKAREKREDSWINSEIGYCLNRLERYEEGLFYLEQAVEESKNDEWFNSEMGFCLKNLGRYEEALSFYKKAEKLGRNDEWLNCALAECLENLGKIEQAIVKLKEALTFEECDELFIKGELGRLYGQEKGNYSEALKYLYEAEKIKNDDIWICSEIGWNLSNICDEIENTQEKTVNFQKALEYLNRAKELGRDDSWLMSQIGFIYKKFGKLNEAISYFEKARVSDMSNQWINYNLAAMYRETGEIEKALNLLEVVIESGQFKGWTDLELAWCYALIDEKEKAKVYLDETRKYIGREIESDPDVKKDFESVRKLISSTVYFS